MRESVRRLERPRESPHGQTSWWKRCIAVMGKRGEPASCRKQAGAALITGVLGALERVRGRNANRKSVFSRKGAKDPKEKIESKLFLFVMSERFDPSGG